MLDNKIQTAVQNYGEKYMQKNIMIQAASQKIQPELVLKNAKIVNVFTGEILQGDIAVSCGKIIGIGEYQGKEEYDCKGNYALPCFINAHVHIESSMVTPEVYAMEELRWGTATIITDPHEIANVSGAEGIRSILQAAANSPLNYYVMLPSCVPSTPFEHAGAVLNVDDLLLLKNDPHVPGLGEMMNSVGVVNCDSQVLAKLEAFSDKIIDGHAPMLDRNSLNAYITAGVNTDHESISFEEAIEKLRRGMAVLVREGSACKNLEAIIKGVVKNHIDTTRMAFCTDDKHLADIRKEGTIRSNVKKAVSLGLSPIQAIQMASINAAQIYHLKNIGAIANGYLADMMITDNLTDFNIIDIFKNGVNIKNIKQPEAVAYSQKMLNSVHTAKLNENAFVIPEQKEYPVIQIIEKQIATKKIILSSQELQDGLEKGNIRKIAVIERHHALNYHAAAYIKNYGLKHGAIATTVAHDSHNIITVGDNDEDMILAVKELQKINGGYLLVQDGKVIESLPLQLCGLMSTESAEEFIPKLDSMIKTAHDMGVNPNIDPFITLSFMALPVIPEIRITDCGLFDVTKFKFIQ